MGGTAKLVGKNLEDALKMLREVCTILEQAGIKYTLAAGTLLGVMRENRLLPWDTDMDIAISSDYAARLQQLRRKIYAAGYLTRYRKNETPLGPVPQNSYRLLRVYSRRFYIFKKERLLDIFVRYKHGDKYFWIVGWDKPLLQFCAAKHMDELAYHSFEGHSYLVPKDFDGYLTQHYGDWRVVKKEWSYRNQDGCNLDANKWEEQSESSKPSENLATH